eukprot:759431-Hanusia_phi.AAC.1
MRLVGVAARWHPTGGMEAGGRGWQIPGMTSRDLREEVLCELVLQDTRQRRSLGSDFWVRTCLAGDNLLV